MRVAVRASRLRRLLVGRNWTQSELARLLEVNRSTISLWIAGRRSPSPAARARLLALLGLQFADVFRVVEDRRIGGRPNGQARPGEFAPGGVS